MTEFELIAFVFIIQSTIHAFLIVELFFAIYEFYDAN